jgi:hypothetical protein
VDEPGVCVPFPTKESVLRNAGKTRGLLVLLAQAFARGQCFFANPSTSMRTPTLIEGGEVETLVPMLVRWKHQDIAKEYAESRKTISCADLFETNEEYFRKVIGMLPSPHCPNPHNMSCVTT